MSPLAEELRRVVLAIGPCSGYDAWRDVARRIVLSRHAPEMRPDLGKVRLIGCDPATGLPAIREADLDAALLEAEQAGGLTCRNLHSSGADQIYCWHPTVTVADGKHWHQRKLFA